MCGLRWGLLCGCAAGFEAHEFGRCRVLRRVEVEDGIGQIGIDVPVAHHHRRTGVREVQLVGDDVLERQGVAGFRDPDLEIDIRPAEDEVVGRDPADDRLADDDGRPHMFHHQGEGVRVDQVAGGGNDAEGFARVIQHGLDAVRRRHAGVEVAGCVVDGQRAAVVGKALVDDVAVPLGEQLVGPLDHQDVRRIELNLLPQIEHLLDRVLRVHAELLQ